MAVFGRPEARHTEKGGMAPSASICVICGFSGLDGFALFAFFAVQNVFRSDLSLSG